MASLDSIEELSSIRLQSDISQIPPINQKRMLTCVNNFLITSVTFLNNLSQVLEEELHENNKVLDRMESEFVLLEQKMGSVAKKALVPKESETKPDTTEAKPSMDEATKTSEDSKEGQDVQMQSTTTTGEDSEAKAETEKTVNPDLVKFFKMVQFGVPVPAVKLKMQQEGFDPNLLDS